MCVGLNLLAFKAVAQDIGNGIWNIGPLHATIEAEDLVQAKQEAITETRFDAFKILLRRLIPSASLSDLSLPEEIAHFELSRQISDEKVGSAIYSAYFSFDFLPSAVENYLQEQNVPYVIASPFHFLVVPDGINLPAGQIRQTLWQDVFEAQDLQTFLGNPIIQATEMEGEFRARLRLGDINVFNHLKESYGVDAVMVISLDLSETPYQLTMQHNLGQDITDLSFSIPPEKLPLTEEGFLQLRARIETFWRNQWFNSNLTIPDKEIIDLRLIAPYVELTEILAIQRTFAQIEDLILAKFDEVTHQSVLMNIHYQGSVVDLQAALAQRGYRILFDETLKAWHLTQY